MNVCVELRGTFDLFALTFHVFDLWCKSSSSCASNDDNDGGSHTELCILLHSLNDLVSNFTSVIPKLPPSETKSLKMMSETTVNRNNNDNINEDNKTTESSLKLNQSTVTPSETMTNQPKRRSEVTEESIVELSNSNNDSKTMHLQMNDDNKDKVHTSESLVTTTQPSSMQEEKKKKKRKSKMKEVSTVNSQDNKNNNNRDDDNYMDNSTMESSLRHYQFVEYTRQLVICLLDQLTRRLRTAKTEIPATFHIETTTLNPLFNVSLQFDQLKQTILSIRQALDQT
ncbi:unnamed protein product [Trichobilharzia szidati]|nr:unnamed protein product [Trichobilharzia szidati]